MELTWNSKRGVYEAPLTDGTTLIVDGDVFAESYPDDEAETHPEAYSAETWLNCLDNERVYVR